MTKKYYREILNNAIIEAKKEYQEFQGIPLNASIYNQLLDIKSTVVEQKIIYTEEESRKRYSLGVLVVRNFDGYLDTDWDYPKQLIDIAGGVSRYPKMPEE